SAPADRVPAAPDCARRARLRTLDHVPAFVVGRRTDVLASNRLARAVLTDFEAMPAVHRNLARFMLLDPAARELYADWETNARDAVAILRLRPAGIRPTANCRTSSASSPSAARSSPAGGTTAGCAATPTAPRSIGIRS
ncbi:MAG: hypothetical protein QOD96_5156, partial [Pseudonocardiales bacterium]|nr:hypothetical protein [Pseudonocardiales bacterium]